MTNRDIPVNIQRQLWGDSMKHCMNPNCQAELFINDTDIAEKAHIDSFAETGDNSYENLVILCPNCHTKFDKANIFSKEEVKQWKILRHNELQKLFSVKCTTFSELEKKVKPLLIENKSIYENYYLKNNKDLWNKFEPKILSNNRQIKLLLQKNINLIQRNDRDINMSNQYYIQELITHIDEFEITRNSDNHNRQVLFPEKVNSIFGIEPIQESIIPKIEYLELLIKKLKEKCKFREIVLSTDRPYFTMYDDNNNIQTVYLDDTPRLRQLYFSYYCLTEYRNIAINSGVRLDGLIKSLNIFMDRNISFKFLKDDNLRHIQLENGKEIIFVYEYCLSVDFLKNMRIMPKMCIVNLHGWNGDGCISSEARDYARQIGIGIELLQFKDLWKI